VWSSLSLLAAAAIAPAQAGPSLLELEVNGRGSGEPVLVHRAGGDFYLPAAAFRGLRIRFDGAEVVTVEGAPHVRLGSLTGVTAMMDEAAQRLRLSVPAGLFEGSSVDFGQDALGPMTPSATGVFLNYELLASAGGGTNALNGAFELGIFTGASFGQTTAIADLSGSRARAVRLDSSWTFDDPARMQSLRIGDAISRGGVGGAPLRFGGIQFARNFAVQPGFVTLPMPRLSGSAALPSIIELYVNNALVGRQEVQPGPFSITSIPITTGNGQVQAIVRDTLGRETIVSQGYYASAGLLRPGLHDFSYELGFLRRDYARRSMSYRAPVASATHRVGLSDRLTVEAHAEATAKVQAAGVAADVALPGLGIAGISLAASRSEEGEGAQIGLRFERQSSVLSIGGSAELTSSGYRDVGSFGERLPPQAIYRLFAGVPTGFGSLGASYLLYQGRGSQPDAEFASANASVRLGAFGTLHLAGRQSLRGERETALEAFVTVPLGGATSASGGLRKERGGLLATATVQKNAPFGEGWGYRAAAALGGDTRLDGGLYLNTAFGEYGAEVSYRDDRLGARVLVAGSVATVGRELFASRKLTDGFAIVQVENHANVRVYADNHMVGRTNRRGRAIVPRLRAYERNEIRLELADLPMDAHVTVAGRHVRPYARSGVAVRFDARRSRSATFRIEVDGMGALPAGGTVQVGGRDVLVAPGGEVYLTDVANGDIVEARWSGGRCSFSLDLPAGEDPQPDLGVRRCQAEAA
jgi:outer membrane usher protein